MVKVKSDIQIDRQMDWTNNGHIYDGQLISSSQALKYGLVDKVRFFGVIW